MFKDAVWLAKKDYKHHWIVVLTTFAFCIFIGLATGGLLLGSESVVIEINSNPAGTFLLDLVFVGMAPAFTTLFMSKAYLSFKAAKQDPYGKRMAFLQSLPIPVSVLALSRTILMLSTLVIMSFAFYGSIATVLYGLNYPGSSSEIMTVNEFIIFTGVWFGFMLAIGGMNPFIEYGTRGVMLHIIPYAYIGLFIVVEIFFYQSYKQGIVEQSLDLVRDIGWPIAVLSIAIGVLCSYVWNHLLKKRLENKDFL